ncbi:MAG: peptidylprolyl isomerase [Planctomycetaceae bacterium]
MRSIFVPAAAVLLLVSSTFAQDETKSSDAVPQTAEQKKEAEPQVSAPPTKPEKAPETFKVKFETSKGDFVVEVTRKWAPLGADQFYNLVKTGFYDDARFFRVLPGFVVQWGISGNPKATENWKKPIKDDPVIESNKKGYITYAKGGPNSRTTQLFVNLEDNARLDKMGFPPFGRVTEGFPVLTKLFADYKARASNQQWRIKERGNEYLNKPFPKLDYIKRASVVPTTKTKPDDAPKDDSNPATESKK